MDKYAAAIAEYESSRVAIKIIKKPLYDLLGGCDFAEYRYPENCIKLLRAYHVWEHSDNGMDEPEFRAPCESCQKALEVFNILTPAKKRFGIAKRRLSALAKNICNPENQ